MKKKHEELSKRKNLIITYGIYIKLIEGIKHFDGIQSIYRSLSSTWLLATFAAIGFIFSGQAEGLPFSRYISVVFVSAIGIIALTVLWALDLIFQERLLISNFVEALKLERTHKWLPPLHNNMLSKGAHYGGTSRKVTFYVGCTSCLFIIMGISILYELKQKSIESYTLVSFLTIIVILLYSRILIKFSGKFEKIVAKILNKSSEEVK